MPQLDFYSFSTIILAVYSVVGLGYVLYAVEAFPVAFFKFNFLNILATFKHFIK